MRVLKSLFLGMIAIIITSCSESLEDRMNKQMATMSEMSELGTVEYTISKIIKANDNAFYTIGDRKILFSCKATMKAGIDLAAFSPDSIQLDKANKKVTIILPQAKVLSFNMPAENIHLEYQKVGTLRSDFTTANRNDLLKQAEEAIIADAGNLGILKDAEDNAIAFFEALLAQVGFDNIEVKFNK